MRTSHSERDSAYGAVMLALRTTLDLTRSELANRLGVSRQTVGEWEAGRNYPKAKHLTELITLAVQQQAFPSGHEAEEIRALWQTTQQKTLLDEHWLSTLLSNPGSPNPTPVGTAPCACPSRACSPPTPRVDWGDALSVPIFYGREEELAQLTQWILQEHCRVVSVLGMGGIGKSALVVNVMHRLADHFEVVVFRSLHDAPPCEMLLDSCLQVLSPEPIRIVPATLEQRISLLLSHLRQTRALLVLDNLECLIEAGDVKGHFCPGFEGYGQLLHQVVAADHQSCLLLTSREKPNTLRLLEDRYSHLRSLHLPGLDITACKLLLEEKEVVGTTREQEQLIEIYAGNPLALKIVAETIVDLFAGVISEFLAGNMVIFGSITDLLEEQFARLSKLEQNMLCWLAILREPVTIAELLALLVTPLPRTQISAAIDSLCQRSLIELGKRTGSFTLQSVVMEYVTSVLIVEATNEIQQRRLYRLIEHGLEQAHASEYVRQAQQRLLVSPLLAELQSTYSSHAATGRQTRDGRARDGQAQDGQAQGTVPTVSVEGQLLDLLDELRKQNISSQGYGPANLITLLRTHRGHLNALDLSHLSLRGSYLQGIEMQDTSLAGSLLRDSVFTEAVSATWAVTISRDGNLWAATGMQGKVRVWNEGGQTLHLIWQAHTDMVQAIAFSPDGQTLATGSLDNTVKLWSTQNAALLWSGWQDCPQSLAFSPNSSLLASAGVDTTVRLWDPQSGENLQTLTHGGDVFALAFSPDGRFLATGCFDGKLRLWQRQQALSPSNTPIFSLHTSWQTSPATNLAFAPDGRTLASANWDRKVTLWEVPSGRLLHTLPGETGRASRVAWSPDGRTLACCSYEKAIWLWDVAQGRHRATLHGHSADINGIAFTPDSSRLLSGGADSTLRVWDVERGQCVRVIASYAVSHYDLDWSPDSTQLVTGGTDGLVTIWNLSNGTPPRTLRGHRWVVYGVGWSPDGRFIGSCGWDAIMCIWDPTRGNCIQKLEDPSTIFLGIAWSPDGSLLACGCYRHGVQVWDVKTRRLRWAGQPHMISFRRLAWSPDGTQLVGSGENGSLCLWEGANGTLLKRLPGHHGRALCVAWSPDGTRLASGSKGELFIWDMQHTLNDDGLSRPVQTCMGHPGAVSALAWIRNHGEHPSREQLVTGGSDGMLRWWDIQSGECVSIHSAHQGSIQSLRVAPNGRQLASCGDDGSIVIWDLHNDKHLRTLKHDPPYGRLNITGTRGLTQAQKDTLQALGATTVDS